METLINAVEIMANVEWGAITWLPILMALAASVGTLWGYTRSEPVSNSSPYLLGHLEEHPFFQLADEDIEAAFFGEPLPQVEPEPIGFLPGTVEVRSPLDDLSVGQLKTLAEVEPEIMKMVLDISGVTELMPEQYNEYVWDNKSNRYRSRKTGRYVGKKIPA